MTLTECGLMPGRRVTVTDRYLDGGRTRVVTVGTETVSDNGTVTVDVVPGGTAGHSTLHLTGDDTTGSTVVVVTVIRIA